MNTITNADAAFTGHEDARLHDEHVALLRYLTKITKRLTRVAQLTDAVRAADATSSGLWLAYSKDVDALSLARLEPLVEEMQTAVKAAASVHETRVASKTKRELRRASIKVEEMMRADAKQSQAQEQADPQAQAQATRDDDTDATEDEEYMVDVDGESDDKQDKAATLDQLTPEKKDQGVAVTLSPSKASVPSTPNKNPLVERAIQCGRFAESLAQYETHELTRPLRKLLEAVVVVAAETNKTFTFPRSGKPRGSLPSELLTPLATAMERAMDRLLHIEMTLALAPSVLRLHEMVTQMRHRELKELFSSAQQILRGVISAFAETLGGMKRTSRRLEFSDVDESAHECFALAIDLLTTSEAREHDKTREKRVDDVLHALKKSFRPVIVRAQQNKNHVQPKRSVLTWAGRVLLLAARIIAHVIATCALLQADQFLKTIAQIHPRHALFPMLFQNMESFVQEAPFMPRPFPPLDLPHEARLIRAQCVDLQTTQ